MAVYTTINDPSAYFQTALYSGNGGGSNVITNDGNSNLQPDFVWVKERSSDSSHALTNSTNGAGYILSSNNTNALSSASAFSSFNSDGFTVGSDGKTNEVNQTYVGWQWKINGGTTSSVGVGSITTTVQANTTAGVSIARYTGNGVNGATIGHGLGKTPTMVWVKCEEGAEGWQVYNVSLGPTKFIQLDATSGAGTNANRWSNTAPTSSIINLGNGNSVNYSGRVFLAFSFAPIQGYSKFSSYVGNGSADGPFVYTGFKPAFLIIKNTSDDDDQWLMWDNKRSPINPVDDYLEPSTNASENVNSNWAIIDFVSNGFKLRNGDSSYNQSGYNYIYMAFAESPFTTSDGVPTTAR